MGVLLVLGAFALWLGPAAWMVRDARRAGRPTGALLVGALLVPGITFAVYVATRANGTRGRTPSALDDQALSTDGVRLLREATAVVARLRAELATRPPAPQVPTKP